MDAAILSFWLILGLPFTSAGVPTETLYAAEGQRYEVPLKRDLKPEYRVKWKDDTETLLFDSKLQTNRYTATEKKSLILTAVSKTHAKKYTWIIFDKDMKQIASETVNLRVIKAVTKPRVTFKCDKNKVQFHCNVTSTAEEMTYAWLHGGKPLPNENDQNLDRTSATLESNSFRCKVSNPVSSESSDSVQQNCLQTLSPGSPGSPNAPDSSAPSEDDNLLFGLDFWLMIGILAGGGGLVLVLIVATIVCCSINRRKRRMQIKNEQELRLQWSAGTNHNHDYINQSDHPRGRGHGHSPRPAAGQTQAPSRDSAGHTGPRPPKARQPRQRPPDPITGQPLPGPRRQAKTGQTQVTGTDEENPPPLPQPRRTKKQ